MASMGEVVITLGDEVKETVLMLTATRMILCATLGCKNNDFGNCKLKTIKLNNAQCESFERVEKEG